LRASKPHPEVQAFLEMYEALNVPPFEELEPQDARQMMEEMRANVDVGIEMENVEDRSIEG